MKVTVLLFASCRELVGTRELTMEVSPGATVQEVVDQIARCHPRLHGLSPSLQTAINEEYADRSTRLRSLDVLALIPPVSGGAGNAWVRLVDEAILPDAVHEVVRSSGDGAVVTFAGVVRDRTGDSATTHLEYEAYRPMAEREMRQLADEVLARWPVSRLAIVHRVGRLEIGEISVLIGVSSPHRGEAFDACRYLIDRLKAVVPIWKKEVGPTGEYWVEGPTAAGPGRADP